MHSDQQVNTPMYVVISPRRLFGDLRDYLEGRKREKESSIQILHDSARKRHAFLRLLFASYYFILLERDVRYLCRLECIALRDKARVKNINDVYIVSN